MVAACAVLAVEVPAETKADEIAAVVKSDRRHFRPNIMLLSEKRGKRTNPGSPQLSRSRLGLLVHMRELKQEQRRTR